MKDLIGCQELRKAKELERSEALRKIRWLMECHDLQPDEILAALPQQAQEPTSRPKAEPRRNFDPFFDAW